jgi:hypothetical protein
VTPRKLDLQRDATRRIIAKALASKHSGDPEAIAFNRWGAMAPDFDLEERAAVGGIGSARPSCRRFAFNAGKWGERSTDSDKAITNRTEVVLETLPSGSPSVLR